MTMRMLIDARHQEETRVAVVKGNRIEEFDFESAEHKQLKGNIYLAKVTRVEPSLQAAFIDYGGNRHGFLAFSEIHPDYYQIPKEDREALLREEAEHAAEEERLRAADEYHDDDDHELDQEPEPAEELGASDDEGEGEGEQGEDSAPRPTAATGSEENAADELRRKRQNLRRRYKIQDVIRRRQVLLVQVVKEERGNKGAALTTYLSLAGRYCVLMPNTSHGGGISRKISNGADRKRLKQIMADLDQQHLAALDDVLDLVAAAQVLALAAKLVGGAFVDRGGVGAGSGLRGFVAHLFDRVVAVILVGTVARVHLGAQAFLFGGVFRFFLQQRVAVGLGDLVVIGVDFAERQETVAIAAVIDERRLQRRLDARDLG